MADLRLVPDINEVIASFSQDPFSSLISSVSLGTFTAVSSKVLEYADNSLVFLRDHSDSGILQTVIKPYSETSSASLNYSKIEVFFLSGSNILHWQEYYSSFDITSCNDQSSSSTLRYLKYPLCPGITQRNVAFSGVLESVKQFYFYHS